MKGDDIAIDASEEVCQVCRDEANRAKYTCPCCGVRTCSVPCVRTHKEQTGCTGKRDKTKFVSMAQYTEETFYNDYTFLEEVHRASSAATAQLQRSKDEQKNWFYIRKKNKLLERKAKQSNISICFLPRVFTKARCNQSVYSVKQQCIFWSLRLVFPYVTLVWQLPRVSENETLKQLLENILQPLAPLSGNEQQVRLQRVYSKYDVEELQVYFVLEKRTSCDDKSLLKCDVNCCLQQILQGKVVVEFPTMVVLLPFENMESIGNNNNNTTTHD